MKIQANHQEKSPLSHDYNDLISIFNRTFEPDYKTHLVKGADEPIYIPAHTDDNLTDFHQIIFAHGYYASALHEIAHWCVAGSERRLLVDYGYWYCPDGRDAQTQLKFESLEIKPQALESLFCAAAGFKFKVSCDNLMGDCEPDHDAFSQLVKLQSIKYQQNGIPKRAAQFIDALHRFYGHHTHNFIED